MPPTKKKSSCFKSLMRKIKYRSAKTGNKTTTTNESEKTNKRKLTNKERLRIKRVEDVEFKEEDNLRRRTQHVEERKNEKVKEKENERRMEEMKKSRNDPQFREDDKLRRRTLHVVERKNEKVKEKENERRMEEMKKSRNNSQFREDDNLRRKAQHVEERNNDKVKKKENDRRMEEMKKSRNDPQFRVDDNLRRRTQHVEERKNEKVKKKENERRMEEMKKSRNNSQFRDYDNLRRRTQHVEERKNEKVKKKENERRMEEMKKSRNDPQFREDDNLRRRIQHVEERKDPQLKNLENKTRMESHKMDKCDHNRMEIIRQYKKARMDILRQDKNYCALERMNNRNYKKTIRLHAEYSYRKNYESELRELKENGDKGAIAQLKYLENIKQGPDCICTCCEGLWFSRSVVKFDEMKIENLLKCSFGIKELKDFMKKIINYKNTGYVCKTCFRYILKGTIPKMATSWGMKFPEVPDCIANLSKLEERMVTPFINFMQIKPLMRYALNPQLQMKGSVVNIMIEMSDMLQVLPRKFDEMATIQVKLKRHIDHKSDYKFETIRPSVICKALNYLVNTPLYKKYNISVSQEYLARFEETDEGFCMSFVIDAKDIIDDVPQIMESEETITNPKEAEEKPIEDYDSDSDYFNDDDEVLVMDANNDVTHGSSSIRIIAPGQDKTPIAWHKFPDLDELCFPRKFAGQPITTHEKLSYSERAKSEARRKDRRCCSPERLLYMAKLKQEKAVSSSINICMRKGKKKLTNAITAKDVMNKTFIDNTIANDAGYKVLRNVRSAPSYWEKRKGELLSMVRQLGHPTFFLTLSSAESRWNELLKSLYLAKHDKVLSDHDILEMDDFTKTKLIREDPVTCARYYDFKVVNFMKLLKSPQGPFGNNCVEDTYEKVEFQQRGSPHEHMFLWCHKAPVYGKDSTEECIAFIDRHICCEYDEKNPLLSMQRHVHTHTCYKGNKSKKVCRFHYPLPVMPRTMILEPLEEEQRSEKENNQIKENSQKIKNKMYSFYMKSTNVSFETILQDLEMSEEDYITAIRSQIDRVRVFLKRDSMSVAINSYNKTLLLLFNSNIDIQYVLDPYSCASYMVNYISKIEAGLSKLLRTAATDANVKGLGIREKLRKISNVFLNANLMSAQEAAYHVVGLPLSKCSRSCIFINSCPREERIRMLKAPKDVINLPEDSIDVFVPNVIDKYAARDGSREKECLADFATAYQSKKAIVHLRDTDSEDSGDEVLKHEDISEDNSRRRKILRYVHYKIENDEYNFYREQILLFYPWRHEEHDIEKMDCKGIYLSNIETIKQNCLKYNVISEDQMAKALEYAQTNAVARDEAEYEEIVADVIPTGMNVDIDEQTGKPTVGGNSKDIKIRIVTPQKSEWEQTLKTLRMLNDGQREIVMHVFSTMKTNDDPLRLFISGAAGVGKSVVISVLFQLVTHFYDKRPGVKSDTPKVLLTAPSGKAAHLISGVTLHTAFALPVTKFGGIMPALSENVANSLRCKLIDLKLLIIDEISMVGSRTLSRVDTRLRQIMGKNVTFGGVSVIVVGDLHQLPPVMDRPVFEPPYVNELSIFQDKNPLWEEFTIYELKEIMRQKGEKDFIHVLNKIARNIELTDEEMAILNTRKVSPNSVPESAIRLFSKNYQVEKYNDKKLKYHPGVLYQSFAEDIILGKKMNMKQENDIKKSIKNRKLCDLQGLPNKVVFKLGIKYMITFNIHVDQGLVNGACGILRNVTVKDGSVKIVWMEFPEERIGNNLKCQYAEFMKEHSIPNNLVPLTRLTSPLTSNPNHAYQLFRKQFPLVPAEALTIHKSQGQSYEEVCVDFKSIDRASRQLLYVALSRVKSLNGLYILGDIDKTLFRSGVSKDCDEMRRLRERKSVNLCYNTLKGKQGLTFIYHNVNSLKEHLIDIEKDNWYSRGDIIICAETLLKTIPSQLIAIGNVKFATVHFSKRVDKKHQRGLLLLAKQNIQSEVKVLNYLSKCEQDKPNKGMELILFSVKNYFIITGYKNPGCSNFFFVNNLKQILKHLNFWSKIIIIGDFNIDVLQPNLLEDELKKYNIISALSKNISTTDFNTQIDIILTNLLISFKFSAGVYDSYFSDHKPVFICVSSQLISDFEDMETNINYNNDNQNEGVFAIPTTSREMSLTRSNSSSKMSVISVSDSTSQKSDMSISDEGQNETIILGFAQNTVEMNTKIDSFKFSTRVPLFSLLNNNNTIQIFKHDIVSLKTKVSEEELTKLRYHFPNFTPKWLTDNIIDGYLYKLSQHYLHFSFGDTIFGQILTSLNHDERDIQNYMTQNLEFSNKTHIALPINVGGVHWVVALINLEQLTYMILDPRSELVSEQLIRAVTLFAKILIQDTNKDYNFQLLQNFKKSFQTDDDNCGVFVCWYAMRFASNQTMFDDCFHPDEFRTDIFNALIGQIS